MTHKYLVQVTVPEGCRNFDPALYQEALVYHAIGAAVRFSSGVMPDVNVIREEAPEDREGRDG